MTLEYNKPSLATWCPQAMRKWSHPSPEPLYWVGISLWRSWALWVPLYPKHLSWGLIFIPAIQHSVGPSQCPKFSWLISQNENRFCFLLHHLLDICVGQWSELLASLSCLHWVFYILHSEIFILQIVWHIFVLSYILISNFFVVVDRVFLLMTSLSCYIFKTLSFTILSILIVELMTFSFLQV